MSRSAIVMVGKSQIGKCLDRQLSNQQMTHQQMVSKCLGRQMSWSAFVRSANVGRETSACKCLVGKRRFTPSLAFDLAFEYSRTTGSVATSGY